MRTITTLAAATIAALGLSSCALPPYTPAAASKTAWLKVGDSEAAYPWICLAGQAHQLRPDEKGYAAIPADGGRVTLGTSFNAQQGGHLYQVSYSCTPRASIIPIAGERYYFEFEQQAERCIALIFKEDTRHRTGLAFDTTYAQSRDCAAR